MFDRLEAVAHRFEEIGSLLQDPSIAGDNKRYRDLMKEYSSLEPLVAALGRYNAAKAACEEAAALLEEGGLEPDFKEMVQQELCENRQKLEPLAQELKLLLLPKDANDEKSVILEIRGGAGGEEAALFAHSLLRMYTMYAQRQGWHFELLNLNETELGGVKEVSAALEGPSVYSRMKFESGVHRVQRVPETETQGRVHTSTVTVAVMPEAEEVDFELDMNDLRIDTYQYIFYLQIFSFLLKHQFVCLRFDHYSILLHNHIYSYYPPNFYYI